MGLFRRPDAHFVDHTAEAVARHVNTHAIGEAIDAVPKGAWRRLAGHLADRVSGAHAATPADADQHLSDLASKMGAVVRIAEHLLPAGGETCGIGVHTEAFLRRTQIAAQSMMARK